MDGDKSPFARKSPKTPSGRFDFGQPPLAISQIIHPDDWVDHGHRRKCYVCAKVFNKLLRRKHNCRMCGEVICSKCRVPQRLVLARHEQPTVAQVCLVCVQKIPVMHVPVDTRRPDRRSSGHNTIISDVNDPAHSSSSSFFVFHDDHLSVTSQSNISSAYSNETEMQLCSYRLDYDWEYPWPKPPPVPSPVEKQTTEMLKMLDILDSAREDAFDRIAASARKSVSSHCKAACVAFMDDKHQRQWFKAYLGLGQAEMPTMVAFCAHTMYLLDVTVVLDTTKDERFCKNPLVTTESTNFRFYAGAPVIVENVCIGTVFVVDSEPRSSLSDVDTLKLTKLAQLTSQLLLERKMLPAHCSIKGGVRSMNRSSSAPSMDQMTLDRQQDEIQAMAKARKRSLEPTPVSLPPPSTPPSTPLAAAVVPSAGGEGVSPSMEAMLMNLLSKTTETQQQIATQQGTLFGKLEEHNTQISKLAEAVARMEAKLSTEDDPPTTQ